MPWKETCAMDHRTRFLGEWLTGEVSMAELCRAYGVSRKTGYKWVRRYQAEGVTGLGERSRAPHTHPQAMASEVAELLLSTRARYTTWGPKKLVAWPAPRHPDLELPAPSTVGDLLQRAGLSVTRPRRRHTPPYTAPLAHADAPNAVWSVDFKGQFRTGDGGWCYPLTIMDGYSRYFLRCQALTTTDTEHVRPLFEATFRECGLPAMIRSDNGPPFASTGLGGLTTLSVWWLKLGILPERIEPGHPEQNGRHERLHRTLKAEATHPPRATVRAQQRAFDRFREEYNGERPHEALGEHPPAAVYVASDRTYQRVTPLRYPEAEKVVQVKRGGEVYLRGQYIHLTEALAGEPVGVSWVAPGRWRVEFGPLVLGYIDERRGKLVPNPHLWDHGVC